MTVERLPARKRRTATQHRSHEDIYALVQDAVEISKEAARQASDASSRADLAQLAMQRIEQKVDGLIKTIGAEGEDERGVRIGTGVVGRLMRLESQVAKRFALYDGWVKTATGAAAAIALASGVVWWLLQDRLGNLLKGN